MNPLPGPGPTILLRTDFTNEAAWSVIYEEVTTPSEDGFLPYLHIIDDLQYEDATPEDIIALSPEAPETVLILVADEIAMTPPDHALLAIDLLEEPGRTLRLLPSVAWSLENNLTLANMGWEEFAEALDENGVFRGFEQ